MMNILEPVKFFKKSFFRNNNLAKAVTGVLLIKILSAIFSLILGVLLGRLLGASLSGVFYLTVTLVTILSTLSRLGMDHALVKIIARYNQRKQIIEMKYISSLSLVLSFVFSLLFAVFFYNTSSIIAINLFEDKFLIAAFQYGSLALIPMTLMSVMMFCLQGVEKIRKSLFLRDGLWVALSCISVILAYYADYDFFVFYGYCLAYLISFVLATIWWRDVVFGAKLKCLKGEASKFVGTSIPMLLTNLMTQVMLWGPLIILGVFSTTSDVGIFALVSRVAGLISFILIAINAVIAPKISKFYSVGKNEDLVKMIRNSARVNILVSTPLAAFFIIFPELVLSLFGEEFEGGKTCMQLLCFAHLFNCFSGSVFFTLSMTKEHKIVSAISSVSVISLVVLSFLLIPPYGLVGAAISASFVMLCHNLIGVVAVYKKLGFNILPTSFRFE